MTLHKHIFVPVRDPKKWILTDFDCFQNGSKMKGNIAKGTIYIILENNAAFLK